MKSAYGMAVPGPDLELTSVKPGTPMGELMRRYWQPLCLSADLADLPVKIRILGEEVVAFRDKRGNVGALEPHCSHRGTSLEFGRIEERGLRCCYHGWLYDTQGHCIEMPCETQDFCDKMNIEHPAYPLMEYGGLVFIYMGPPDIAPPLLPMLDIVDTRHRDDVVLMGMRLWDDRAIGFVRDCNWLQHFENQQDPWHLTQLHNLISGDQFNSVLTEEEGHVAPKISWEKTKLGQRYNMVKQLPNGLWLERHTEVILPNIHLVANIHQRGEAPVWREKASEMSWCVPVDDEHIRGLSIVAWPKGPDGKPVEGWIPGTWTKTPFRPGQKERPYEEAQRAPDDLEATESIGPISVHARENLGKSDMGVAMLRRTYRQMLRDMRNGKEPSNLIRTESENHALETSCWNTVMTPEQYEERRAAGEIE